MAVAGGGPAGLYAALEGIKRGMQVTLFEKYRIGDQINCAEGIFDFLNQLGRPEKGVRHKVENILIELDETYRFKNIALDIWMIDRAE